VCQKLVVGIPVVRKTDDQAEAALDGGFGADLIVSDHHATFVADAQVRRYLRQECRVGTSAFSRINGYVDGFVDSRGSQNLPAARVTRVDGYCDADISQPAEQQGSRVSSLHSVWRGLFDHASEVEDHGIVVAPVESGGPLGHLRHDSTARATIKPPAPNEGLSSMRLGTKVS
jgi:hypothetical protein